LSCRIRPAPNLSGTAFWFGACNGSSACSHATPWPFPRDGLCPDHAPLGRGLAEFGREFTMPHPFSESPTILSGGGTGTFTTGPFPQLMEGAGDFAIERPARRFWPFCADAAQLRRHCRRKRDVPRPPWYPVPPAAASVRAVFRFDAGQLPGRQYAQLASAKIVLDPKKSAPCEPS
jgi:hypothetical protein